jgi:prevent-host-death family protein
MAENSWSVREAKTRFNEVVEAARHRPQTITVHGNPAVVVVDLAEYERLLCLERTLTPSFADVLLAIPQDDGEFSRPIRRARDLDN